jgi:CBS-domain-containing membrane protein
MVTGGLHRLAVLNDRLHRGLVGIFTQSMLISELTQRIFMLVQNNIS